MSRPAQLSKVCSVGKEREPEVAAWGKIPRRLRQGLKIYKILTIMEKNLWERSRRTTGRPGRERDRARARAAPQAVRRCSTWDFIEYASQIKYKLDKL